MNKPVLGLLLGGVLGALDGLSALVSAPETAPQILGIVVGSTVKGLIVGIIVGFFAHKVRNLTAGTLFGMAMGLLFAGLIVWMQVKAGEPAYWLEIMLPGTLVGLIVGYATQRYGATRAQRAA